jgi:hypothetical protein
MQNNFNTDIRKLQPIFGAGQSDHSEIFGIYIFGIFSEKGENHIHRDVLGNYPLFIGYNKNLTAISNNPYLVAQAIYGNDFLNHKNIWALANIVASGEIADNQTTFSDVYRVPQNSGIKIDLKNSVSFYSLVDDMYYPMSDSEWNARLDRESEKMVQFLKHYIKTAPSVGGNITGGFDSRVLLSLSLQAGITKDVVYTVKGYPDHPDVIIAKQIAEHFGLNLIVQDVTPPKDINDEIIKNSFEKTLANFSNTAGTNAFTERWMGTISGMIAALKQNNTPVPRTLLTGSSIEMFRGYHSLHFLDHGITNLQITEYKELFDNIISPLNQKRFTEKTISYFNNSYMKIFKSFDETYSNDLVLMQLRLPQFHGGLSRKNNNWFSTIGFNSWLHRLSMIQAPEKRAATDIPFKIIEKYAPDLLYFPFDRKTWHYLAYTHRTDADKILAVKPVENVNNFPLPSSSNILSQIKYLLENKIEFEKSIYEVFDKQWLDEVHNRAQKMISGAEMVNPWHLVSLVNVYGISLFMQNREENLSADCPKPTRLDYNTLARIENLYTPPPAYSEPAEQVLQSGALLFQKKKVFTQNDHNHLTDHERFIFDLDIQACSAKTKNEELTRKLNWERCRKKES